MDFSVGLVTLSIIAPRVMRTLPVVHAVHMSVIIYGLHDSQPVGHRGERFALHVVMIVYSSEACKKIKKLLSLRLRVLPTDIMCMSGSAFQWMAPCWGFGAKPLKVQVLPFKSDL